MAETDSHNKNHEIEASQETKDGMVTASLEKIRYVYSKVKEKLGISGPEAVAKTDEFLVEVVEKHKELDDTETALVEGAMEAIGDTESSGPNPIETLENGGLDELVTEAVEDLAEHEATLPSGEDVAEVVVGHLARLETEKQVPEVIDRLERYRYVKEAPRLEEQLKEDDRNNLITYLPGNTMSVGFGGKDTSLWPESNRATITEGEALIALREFLTNAISKFETHNENDERAKIAKDILENLTFIGEKELREAIKGIADYWKYKLKNNPELHILALTEVAEINYNEFDPDSDKNKIKSDDWLLDNVLAEFNDQELAELGGRIIFNASQIPDGIELPDLRVILLDDWTISGTQLQNVYEDFLSKHPEYADCIEIQLVATSEKRIEGGLAGSTETLEYSIPIRSYFKAHDIGVLDESSATLVDSSGARITGSHSSVDWDFEKELEWMVDALQHLDPLREVTMPPTTNIVRPYRRDGYTLSQKERFELARGK